MNVRKIMCLILIAFSFALPNFSWLRAADVSDVGSTPWYIRYPGALLSKMGEYPRISLCGAVCAAALGYYGYNYTKTLWANRKFSNQMGEKLMFNALEKKSFKIYNFAINDYDHSGISFPDFIDIKIDHEESSQARDVGHNRNRFVFKLIEFLTNQQIMINEFNQMVNWREVIITVGKEMGELCDLIKSLDTRTGLNDLIKTSCIAFAKAKNANDREKWKAHSVGDDFYTDLSAIIFQCETTDEFKELELIRKFPHA